MRLDKLQAIHALEVFLQSAQSDRRDAAVEDPQNDLEKIMGSGLNRQGQIFRRGMRGLRTKWEDDGSIWRGDWLPYLQVAQDSTRGRMRTGLFANILDAVGAGQGHLVDDIGSPISITFGHNDPFAIEYARNHAAEQIKKIDDATKEGVHRVIERGVREGSSYGQVMTNLRNMYGFSRQRAKNIAVFEVGDAYEAGRRMAVDEMRAQGISIVKAWSNVGDSHVRPAHIANQNAGWIALDATFPGDGASRPPTDPRCRCTALYRRGTPDSQIENQAPREPSGT